MTDLSDSVIVARVLSGQRDAFGLLVRRYQKQLLAYVRYMGFDEPSARDLVQDGFVRAFRHLRRCGDPERFEGWLFKIVSNLCRTAGAKRSRRPLESLDVHASDLVSGEPGPEELVEVDAVRRQVEAALGMIAPEQREAVVLMYLQDRSVREIAEMTDASVSAVKMRLKRGREALRRELEPHFPREDS